MQAIRLVIKIDLISSKNLYAIEIYAICFGLYNLYRFETCHVSQSIGLMYN